MNFNTRSAWAPIAVGLGAAALVHAQPLNPVYSQSFADCTTGDNVFSAGGSLFWTVDGGCDVYQVDLYERPTIQEYKPVAGKFASKEYFEYLDLAGAKIGLDDTYLYVSLDTVGRNNITSGGSVIEQGMVARYGFRFSTDPDGRFGVLITADQPELKIFPNTTYGNIGLFGYHDTNGDVGGAASSGPTGLTVTNTDNPNENSGLNGFDEAFISDGVANGVQPVVWARLSPGDNTVVEFALDYQAIGYTKTEMQNLKYFDVEATSGGTGGPGTYLWNDSNENVEAGSPNPGPGGQTSEFGTEGLKNIYEVDTLRVSAAGTACVPDFNGDGALTIDDFIVYQTFFAIGDPSADVDGDGALTISDFITFQTLFAIGC